MTSIHLQKQPEVFAERQIEVMGKAWRPLLSVLKRSTRSSFHHRSRQSHSTSMEEARQELCFVLSVAMERRIA